MMEPKVAAASSELTGYANANKAALPLMPKSLADNPLIYPPADVRARFYTITAANAEQLRERTRLWTAIKTGR
jgi:putrescine transport system substrate-binding protein